MAEETNKIGVSGCPGNPHYKIIIVWRTHGLQPTVRTLLHYTFTGQPVIRYNYFLYPQIPQQSQVDDP